MAEFVETDADFEPIEEGTNISFKITEASQEKLMGNNEQHSFIAMAVPVED